ncbi:ABC transporter permease [Oryzomicrobium sp.]|uniref:ABC transporter permease n=1 Tax=Oryzomicrobium sp. TaxID=1911578 RepID=UPI0025DA8FA1|nr:ABC transporter permease [Oryzomicrobium sp.]MCE1243358.1 ABC transporter permease [Oryzomicrobium sp.]
MATGTTGLGGTLANILNLGIKELRSLKGDPLMLAFIVWAFTGGIYAVGSAVSMELHNAPVAVVDEDQSPLSHRLADALQPPRFKVPQRIGLADMDPGLDQGRYTFVLDIPPHYQRDLNAGRAPLIQLNIDATQMSQAFIGAGYIQTIVNNEVGGYLRHNRPAEPLPAGLTTRMRFNPNLDSAWFGSVMEIVNQITLLSIILAGAALIREREHGTLEHLLVMPLTPFEIMSAKVWANGLVVLAATGLSLQFVVKGVLGVPISGSLALFLCGTALHLFSTTAMGIFLATVARSMPQMGLLLILAIVPLQILSGATTPRESMPELVQTLMLAAPTTHFVAFAQAILYRGAGLDVVWPQFLAIALIGTVFFLAALARFRKTVAAMQG